MKERRGKILAEKERLAKVRLRKYARRIRDNAQLANLLMQFDKPFRPEFYRRVVPYVKFKALPIEEILHEPS